MCEEKKAEIALKTECWKIGPIFVRTCAYRRDAMECTFIYGTKFGTFLWDPRFQGEQ